MSGAYSELLKHNWEHGKFLCVGLDSEFEKLPEQFRSQTPRAAIAAFNRAIVDATSDLVCAYKPNSAFYEAYGAEGWLALADTVKYIKETAPEVPVILDAKRADIGNTNKGYVTAFFDGLGVDAVTVHPYLGSEAMAPFLERKDKGIIVLCRTSNPGAAELQDLAVAGKPLYIEIARKVAEDWNTSGNCSLVVGATYPEEMKLIRAVAPEVPFLIPGIGAQGGELESSVQAGLDANGRGIVIAASRAVIFASSGSDFAEAARTSAQSLDSAIRKAV